MSKSSKSLEEVLREGKLFLREKRVIGGSLDAELLLMHLLNKTKVQLFTHSRETIDEKIRIQYFDLLTRRGEGVPTQYLVGRQEFMGLPFYVNEEVLIPRPDTEILVETVLNHIQRENMKLLIDIGTGSGCIPVSLCWNSPEIQMIGVDISKGALKVARKNGVLNKVEHKIGWIESDIFQKLPEKLIGQVDGIVSNPPYIPAEDITELMKEVRDYEPRHALDGGEDGLDFYRNIINQGRKYLISGGYMFFEVGHDQSDAVKDLLKVHDFIDIKSCKDLAGIDRVVYGKKALEA